METLNELLKKYELYLCQENAGFGQGCFFCAEAHPTAMCPNIRSQQEYWDIEPYVKLEDIDADTNF